MPKKTPDKHDSRHFRSEHLGYELSAQESPLEEAFADLVASSLEKERANEIPESQNQDNNPSSVESPAEEAFADMVATAMQFDEAEEQIHKDDGAKSEFTSPIQSGSQTLEVQWHCYPVYVETGKAEVNLTEVLADPDIFPEQEWIYFGDPNRNLSSQKTDTKERELVFETGLTREEGYLYSVDFLGRVLRKRENGSLEKDLWRLNYYWKGGRFNLSWNLPESASDALAA